MQLIFSMLFFFSLGEARIRVQISVVHSTSDIDRCVDAFVSIGREKGVIQ